MIFKINCGNVFPQVCMYKYFCISIIVDKMPPLLFIYHYLAMKKTDYDEAWSIHQNLMVDYTAEVWRVIHKIVK